MLTKTKKNVKKINFWKTKKKKMSGDMLDRYLSPKFGVNPLEGSWENYLCLRTEGRTDDGRPRHDSTSAVQ